VSISYLDTDRILRPASDVGLSRRARSAGPPARRMSFGRRTSNHAVGEEDTWFERHATTPAALTNPRSRIGSRPGPTSIGETPELPGLVPAIPSPLARDPLDPTPTAQIRERCPCRLVSLLGVGDTQGGPDLVDLRVVVGPGLIVIRPADQSAGDAALHGHVASPRHQHPRASTRTLTVRIAVGLTSRLYRTRKGVPCPPLGPPERRAARSDRARFSPGPDPPHVARWCPGATASRGVEGGSDRRRNTRPPSRRASGRPRG
jgi:hypothetical protein